MNERPALHPSDHQIIAVLSRHGELSRGRLASLSGMPRSTITDAVARLERLGIVVERAIAASERPRAGRPPRVLALAAPPGLVGVVALTHESLQAGVLGFDGTLRSRRQIEIYQHGVGRQLSEEGLELLGQAITGVSGELACVIVGMPMPIGPEPLSPGTSLKAPWLPADPAAELARILGVPVWAENDANLGALGEGAFGVAREMTSFIYLKIVQGVGAGLVLERRLHRGTNGLAGELAHIHVEDDGAVCRCGGRGCLMTTLNTPRLIDRIQAIHPSAVTMTDVLALAVVGDPGVCRLLRDLGRVIGRSLADFCVYVAPDGVIIDGLLQNASVPVIEGIRESLSRFAPPAIASQVRVVTGTLGDQAELRGGVVLARYNQFGHELL
jgi:predicted NBD/HSP70 family sugar kinase